MSLAVCLVSVLAAPIVAVKFGRFGRDDGALVLVSQTGELVVKMLKREFLLSEMDFAAGQS